MSLEQSLYIHLHFVKRFENKNSECPRNISYQLKIRRITYGFITIYYISY